MHNSTLSDTVVSNSTISDNGSGIYNDNGALAASVYNTTMSNNGVEIRNFNSPVVVAVSDTIFNVSPGGHSILNDFGTVTSYGYNVSSDDGAGYLNGTGDQINTDPMLGPLQDNGGPTFTHALLPGSPAINAGDPNFVGPPDYDQRGPGYDRVRGGRIDVGSFEVKSLYPHQLLHRRPDSRQRPGLVPPHRRAPSLVMKKKRTAQFGSFSLQLVLCSAAVCSMITGTLLAFFHPEAPAKASQRMLTFAERVAYQRAIEEVYWRHRIWPRTRASDTKPSLDEVMPQAQIEKKVADYLRESQALEDYWQSPITPEQLQAEMDRMAQHTKQPGVLRELFEALGNDPFVIAECLARPVLEERVVADPSVVAGVSPAPRSFFAADTAASAENGINATNLNKATFHASRDSESFG